MKKAPYPWCMISGAIGKKIVVKQYRRGTVITGYPDMKKIVASDKQRNYRNLFKEAVAFATAINNNPQKKKEYQQKIPNGTTVFNMAVKEYIMRARTTS
jgi:hypothetical protein